MDFLKWLKTWAIIALGVLIAAATCSGIQFRDSTSLFLAVIVISILNMIIRPILILFTLPFIIMTFGLGIIIINALLFMLVAKIVPGFEVASFWSALWGAFIVGLTSIIANMILGSTKVQVRTGRPRGLNIRAQQAQKKKVKDDDVIDV
jgi:putative membrane protein